MKLYHYGKSFLPGLQLNIGTLYQVEELSLMRADIMPEHSQRCDEITYVISGKAKMYTDDVCEEISGGQIHYVQKGCMHKIEVSPDEDFRYICIGYTLNENAIPEPVQRFLKTQKHFLVWDNATLRKLCPLLVDEFYPWDDLSCDAVSAYLYQILIATYRCANATLLAENSRNTSEKAARSLSLVICHIASIRTLTILRGM
jgi:quercetin dioxygenase-like cupin family protein